MSRLALGLAVMWTMLASTARADDDEGPGQAVTELLEDCAPLRARRGRESHLLLRSSELRAWIARHFAVPRSALARMPAGGARGERRWSARQLQSVAGTTTYLWLDTGGECPSTERIVMVHDATGRLTVWRRLAETCEGVDSMFHEERLAYDARGRIREVVRRHLRRLIDVPELEDLDLTEDLTLPDGSMPPTWDPPARCVFEHEARATRMTCGDDRDPAQVTRTFPTP